jgi:large subunit ribosomal protein L19
MKKLRDFIKSKFKTKIPDIRAGDTVRVQERIKEGNRTRIQIFEGVVLARKHGEEPGATITVRRIVDNVGVEKIFPLHLPAIEKIEIIKRAKVRRAKLYYLREAKGKRARLKRKDFDIAVLNQEEVKEEIPEKEKEGVEKKEEKQEEVTKSSSH